MAKRLQKPNDPYDPAWVEYARQNPGLRRSLSAADAADDDIDDDAGGSGFDLGSFVPENFKGEDGSFDTAGFRASYDDLVTFKSQADEAKSALPQSPEEYEATLPEDFQLLEGFDPKSMAHVDDDGNEVEFDPASMIDKDDPDMKLLQGILHEAGASKDVMAKLMGVVVNRELRSVMSAQEAAVAQMKALGPEGKSRIDSMKRTLGSRLPEAQATALLDSITSADTLRGLEALLRAAPGTATPAPGKINHADMNPMDRLMHGLSSRDKKRA